MMTRDDVVAVLGPVDETLLAEIVASNATRDELAQAWAWLNSDDALIGELRHLPNGKVAELINLLAPPEDDEP
ncbi:MAG: hypothetical protein ACREC1_10620 [Methylovirgula sp.]